MYFSFSWGVAKLQSNLFFLRCCCCVPEQSLFVSLIPRERIPDWQSRELGDDFAAAAAAARGVLQAKGDNGQTWALVANIGEGFHNPKWRDAF